MSTVFLLLAVFSLAGCAASPIIRVEQGPPQDRLVDLERKLHRDSAQLEEELHRNGALYEDAGLNAYLRQLGERLRPPDGMQSSIASDFRLVRDPTVNAFALPNGKTYYHIGLLAKMRNPEMLAAVMGHEISHVAHRDSLYWVDDYHQKTATAKIAQMVLVPGAAFAGSAAGVGGLANLANLSLNLIYAASVTGYGRENEARADSDALTALSQAGINPASVAHVFEAFLKEEERYQRGPEIWFLMSHPSTRRRLANATAWLKEQRVETGPAKDNPAFLRMTDALRLESARLNIQYERYFHALDLVEDVLKRQPEHAGAVTLQAICYQRLAEDPDVAERELTRKTWKKVRPDQMEDWKTVWQEKSATTFEQALSIDPHYPEAHQGLGFLQAGRGNKDRAIESLETYLRYRPEAADRRFVTSQLARWRKELEEEKSNSKK